MTNDVFGRPEVAPPVPVAGWFYRAAAFLAFLTVAWFVVGHGAV